MTSHASRKISTPREVFEFYMDYTVGFVAVNLIQRIVSPYIRDLFHSYNFQLNNFINMIARFISSILNYILGTCGFLFRHILKASFIDPSSNPKLRFENNKTTLSISTCDVSNLEKDIA